MRGAGGIGAGWTGSAVGKALLLPAWPSDLEQATAAGAWSWESVSPAARCPEGNYLPSGTNLILLSFSLPVLGHQPVLASRCLPPPLMPGEPAVRAGGPHPSLWEQHPPAVSQAFFLDAGSQHEELRPWQRSPAHHRAAEMGWVASWAPLHLVL